MKKKNINPFPKGSLLKLDDRFKVPALSGESNICQASDVFPAFIDSCFQKTSGKKATKETYIAVYQVMKPATFYRTFLEIPGLGLNKVLSQHQIIEIVRSHPEIFIADDKRELFTFFICQKNEGEELRGDILKNQLFLAQVENFEPVFAPDLGLAIHYIPLGEFDLWNKNSTIKIVAPCYLGQFG